jgi:hypothetical protein
MNFYFRNDEICMKKYCTLLVRNGHYLLVHPLLSIITCPLNNILLFLFFQLALQFFSSFQNLDSAILHKLWIMVLLNSHK